MTGTAPDCEMCDGRGDFCPRCGALEVRCCPPFDGARQPCNDCHGTGQRSQRDHDRIDNG